MLVSLNTPCIALHVFNAEYATALDFRQWLGGEEKINEYCHDLAMRGGKRLAELLGTSLLDKSENGEETLNMVRSVH